MSFWGKVGAVLAPMPDVDTASIKLLMERLRNSTTADESKKLLKILKAQASNKAAHEEIGKGMAELLSILRTEKEDVELTCDVLEILNQIMTCPKEGARDASSYVELVNTEEFLRESKNVMILLELLEQKKSYVRLNTTQLLITLLTNKDDKIFELQDIVLRSPVGIPYLMELLADSRDSVRNEGLLLLQALVENNQEIQKIVAFNGAFDRLFTIIESEGGAEGGIVVQDCLCLMSTLLNGNVSNQNYFRETSCIQRLPLLLELESSDMWLLTDNKQAVLVHTLKLISLLISENNPNTHTNQLMMNKHGVLTQVVRLAISRINSADARSQALRTLGDMLRGCSENRTAFSAQVVETGEDKRPQPALHRLVVIMLHSREITERLAAMYTFQCYLHANEEAQLAIASTLTPPPTITNNLREEQPVVGFSIGRKLIHALLGEYLTDTVVEPTSLSPRDHSPRSGQDERDALCPWFAACVLSSILSMNEECKELVLRIPLEIPRMEGPLPTLMTKCNQALFELTRAAATSNESTLYRVGLLRLLCTWLYESPASVKAFLSAPKNLPFMMETVMQPPASHNLQVQGLCAMIIGLCFQYDDDASSTSGSSFNRTALHNVITNRIGLAKFTKALESLRKSPAFIFAEQEKVYYSFPIPFLFSYKYIVLLSLQDVVETKEEAQSFNIRNEQCLNKILYDYDFTIFFKDCYDKLTRQLRSPFSSLGHSRTRSAGGSLPSSSGDLVALGKQKKKKSRAPSPEATDLGIDEENELEPPKDKQKKSSQMNDAILQSYKELIHNQDIQMEALKQKLAEMEAKLQENSLRRINSEPSFSLAAANESSSRNNEERNNELKVLLQQREAEIAFLKKRLEQKNQNDAKQNGGEGESTLQEREAEIASLREELLALSHAFNELELHSRETEEELERTRQELSSLINTSGRNENEQERRKKMEEELIMLRAQLEAERQERNKMLEERRMQHTNTEELERVQRELEVLKRQQQSPTPATSSPQQAAALPPDEETIRYLEERIEELEAELQETKSRFASLEEEQNDLLVCLAKAEMENNNLKQRLSSSSGR
ncbi:Vesicle-mediated ER to Golgi transport protein [Balamuthia mandrillaris]